MPPTKRTRGGTHSPTPAWGVELHTERCGPFSYRYHRIRIERLGRRASVREFKFRLDFDTDLFLLTPTRQLVRQRGRSLPADECAHLWSELTRLRELGLEETYPCLDDTDPRHLDPARDPAGVPVAVLLGEEGPACLTLRSGRERDPQEVKRILIDRCCALEAPHRVSPEDEAPLTALVRVIEPGLREVRPFNYRRTRILEDLRAEFTRLKALDFLNLRSFEQRFVESLGWLRDPAAVPVLIDELFASNPAVRLQALEALASIGDGVARPDVELLCYDDDPLVRERARSTLMRLEHQVHT